MADYEYDEFGLPIEKPPDQYTYDESGLPIEPPEEKPPTALESALTPPAEEVKPSDQIDELPHDKLMESERYRQVYTSALPVLKDESKAETYAKERIKADAESIPFLRDGIFADMMGLPKTAPFDLHYGHGGGTDENPSGGVTTADELRKIKPPTAAEAAPGFESETGLDFGTGGGQMAIPAEAGPALAHEWEALKKAGPRMGMSGVGMLTKFVAELTPLAVAGTGGSYAMAEEGAAPIKEWADGVLKQTAEESAAAVKSGEATPITQFAENVSAALFQLPEYMLTPEIKGAHVISAAVSALPASYTAAKEKYETLIAEGATTGEALAAAGVSGALNEGIATLSTLPGGTALGKFLLTHMAVSGGGAIAVEEVGRVAENFILQNHPELQRERDFGTEGRQALVMALLPLIGKAKQLPSSILQERVASTLKRAWDSPDIAAAMETTSRVGYVQDSVLSGEKSPLWGLAELSHVNKTGEVRDLDHFDKWLDKTHAEEQARRAAAAGQAQTEEDASIQVMQPTAAETATPEARDTLEAAQALVGSPNAPGTAIDTGPLPWEAHAEKRQATEQQAAEMRARVAAEQKPIEEAPATEPAPTVEQPPATEPLLPEDFQARVAQAQEKVGQPFVEEAPPTPVAPKRAGQVTPEMAADAAAEATKREQMEQGFAQIHAPEPAAEATREEGLQQARLQTEETIAAEAAARARGEGEPQPTAMELAFQKAKGEEAPPRPKFDEEEPTEERKLPNLPAFRDVDGAAETDNGIPRGLEGEKTDASKDLEDALNDNFAKPGGPRASFEEVRRDRLPDAVARAFKVGELFTGNRIAVVRETSGVRGEVGPHFTGVTLQKGVLYVHEQSSKPLMHVISHEWSHQLEVSAPHLYEKLSGEVKRQGRLEAYQQHLENRGSSAAKIEGGALSELTANATGDAMGDHTFMTRMAGENPILFRGIAGAYKRYLDRFIGENKDLGSNRFMTDVTKFRDVLADVLHQHASEKFGLKKPTAAEAAKQGKAAPMPVPVMRDDDRVDPQTREPKFKKFFGKSQVTEDGTPGGEPKPVYHGTMGNITGHERGRASPEGDWGAGHYFSSSPEDVETNYSHEGGPDFKHKLDGMIEQIIDRSEEPMTHEEAEKIARDEIGAEHQGMTMKNYIRMETPLKLGGDDPTEWHYDFDEDTGEESGDLMKLREAMLEVAPEFEETSHRFDPEKAFYDMMENVGHAPGGEDGYRAGAYLNELKQSEHLFAEDEQGRYATNEYLRKVLEHMGYDGVIDKTVASKFKGMKGMDADTTHYVVFDGHNVKSAIGNRGTWDRSKLDVAFREEGKNKPGVSEDEISTRLPTAKGATEDPMKDQLVTGVDAMRKDPEAFDHNVALVSGEIFKGGSTAEKLLNHMRDNLLWLHDKFAPEIRARAKLWYDGAHKIATEAGQKWGVERRAASGVYASLSPQKDWFMNVSLGNRVMQIVKEHWNTKWTPEMEKTSERIYNKKLTAAQLAELSRTTPEQMAELKAKVKAETATEEEAATYKRVKKNQNIVSGNARYAEMLKTVRGSSMADLEKAPAKQRLALQSMWLRAHDETYNTREYNVIHPEGTEGGRVLAEKGKNKGKPAKVAWGSFGEIGKAISIMRDSSQENISARVGKMHKVRNFFNNIESPNSALGHVTSDTHNVAAAHILPLAGAHPEVQRNFGGKGAKSSSITGNSGTYGLYHEAIRLAAKERNILPREMQSITWEAVRGLFPKEWKTKTNVAAARGVWNEFKDGSISADEAREKIFKLAGGIRDPDWHRPGAGSHGVEGVADHEGHVPERGVPGRDTGAVDGGARVEPTGEAAGLQRGRRRVAFSEEENVAPHSDEKGDGEPVRSVKTPIGTLHVETAAGQTRTGKGEDGKPFSRTMKHDYGYIENVPGRDGGSMDVLLGEGATNPMRPVFVVHQKNAEGGFDEHKVLVGFKNQRDAERAYLSEYPKGWDRMGEVEQFTTGGFKQWAKGEGREQAQVGKVDPSVPRFQVRPQQPDSVAMHAMATNPMPVRTGHTGDALERLDLPNAAKTSQARTHFDDASKVTGTHQVVLRNLYDTHADPRGLFDEAVRTVIAKKLPLDEPHVANELENHIVAAGFDGYRSRDGKAVVLGGKVKMEKANAESTVEPVAAGRPVAEPAHDVVGAEAPVEAPRPDVTRAPAGPREDHALDREGKGDEGTDARTEEDAGKRVPERPPGKAADQDVDELTAIRNRATDEVRILRGAEPHESVGGRSVNEIETDARVKLAQNPNVGRAIAQEVAKKARNISDVEAAILAIDRQRIEQQHTAKAAQVDKLMGGDVHEHAVALSELKMLEDAREANERATKNAGTEWSNSGRARNLAVKRDESLVSLLTKQKIAGDKDLSDEVRKEITKEHAEMETLKQEIESPGFEKKPEIVENAAKVEFEKALEEIKKMSKDEMMTKECYI